jgi:actin-related protein 2
MDSSSGDADKVQMADKENMWISKAEWEEQGARALEKLGAR